MGTLATILFIPLPMPTPQERHITIDASQSQFIPGRLEANSGDHVILVSVIDLLLYAWQAKGNSNVSAQKAS